MQQLKSLHINKTNQGQSLVELALFLPILIFILVGIVEVGNLLNTQNRVTTASRVAAGFGATNFDPVDWPGTADAMGVVALNTVTETLELSPDLWDIWSVHAITNEDGTGFDVYTSTQVFGIQQRGTSGRMGNHLAGCAKRYAHCLARRMFRRYVHLRRRT